MRARRALGLAIGAVLVSGAPACSLIDDFGKFASVQDDLQVPVVLDLAVGAGDLAVPPGSDSALGVHDLAAGIDAPLDLAMPDLQCVAGCQGSTNVSCVKPPEVCAIACVPAGNGLPSHCALVPTGGDLCGGKYQPALMIPPGSYELAGGQGGLPILQPRGGGPMVASGALSGQHFVFCYDSIAQGIGTVIIDATVPGFGNTPLAFVTKNDLVLDNVLIWATGADAKNGNLGLARNGGGSGAPPANSAHGGAFGLTGGWAGTDANLSAGGGGGGNKGGKGGDGAMINGKAGGVGGAGGASPVGIVGGAGGGGAADATNGGAGGAGGGVLQLSAGGKLEIAGAIYVMGGAGGHGALPQNNGTPGGGGGGGGGGTVLLEAPVINYSGVFCVHVNGGYGGSGAGLGVGMGGLFFIPLQPTCPLSATPQTGGQGGGVGGQPANTDNNGAPNGFPGMGIGSGGGGAGGPGALHQRALHTSGVVTVYPNTPATNLTDPF